MIDSIVSLLGYTGSDPVVTYLCVAGAMVLILVLAYRFMDFLLSLVTGLINRNRYIKL